MRKTRYSTEHEEETYAKYLCLILTSHLDAFSADTVLLALGKHASYATHLWDAQAVLAEALNTPV
jgi:hypothetical protein